MSKQDLIVIEGETVRGEATREARTDAAPVQGAWYLWTREEFVDPYATVKVRKVETDLVCVVRIGSNYVKVAFTNGATQRVHADRWHEFALEPDAEAIIARDIASQQAHTTELLNEVRELTMRLGVGQRPTLAAVSEETGALVKAAGTGPIDEYKAALVKAETKDLPQLFEAIRKSNERTAVLMKAQLLPLEAQVKQLQPAIEQVKRRIHSVELYAGLTEQVVEVRGGEPAPYTERIRLFQRRAYMDEECLAQYRTGGMTFKDIGDFDAWMAEPANFERLLPFPRCALAFQVRRHDKDREFQSLSAWISFQYSGEAQWDKYTFLYIRNGEQLHRLRTSIDFGPQLFPDLDHSTLAAGKDLVAYAFIPPRFEKLYTVAEYEAMVAEDEAAKRAYEAEQAALPKKERSPFGYSRRVECNRYHRWTPDSVYYDDISAFVADEVRKHNQLALVLQGLLDRSPIWNPHPAWQTYTGDGFEQAFELVYDDTRAMVTGDKPDFEAYRKRLNASLRKGSITVGQYEAWLEHEAEIENAKRAKSWRHREGREYTRFKPYGDPGPGYVAEVVMVGKRAMYRWHRERRSYRSFGANAALPRTFSCPVERVLNVSAYTPGDFKQFFNDPRTRADYRQWAPLLLDAEEYHAGNLKPGHAEDGRHHDHYARGE